MSFGLCEWQTILLIRKKTKSNHGQSPSETKNKNNSSDHVWSPLETGIGTWASNTVHQRTNDRNMKREWATMCSPHPKTGNEIEWPIEIPFRQQEREWEWRPWTIPTRKQEQEREWTAMYCPHQKTGKRTWMIDHLRSPLETRIRTWVNDLVRSPPHKMDVDGPETDSKVLEPIELYKLSTCILYLNMRIMGQ